MDENTEMMTEETTPDIDVETETAEETESNWDFGEETAATDSGEEAEEQKEQQEETTSEDLFPGEFVVDGENRQVTMSQADGLIRKGLQYDSLKGKYMDKLKDAYADPSIAFVADLAKAAGKSPAEYMAAVRNQQKYADLIKQYGDISDVPDNVMQMFAENNKNLQDSIAKDMQAHTAKLKEQQLLDEFETFRENHPEVQELPKEVIALKSKGESLEGAYAIVQLAAAQKQIADLTRENKILKQNSKNTQSSMPSGRNTAQKDDVLSRWSFD